MTESAAQRLPVGGGPSAPKGAFTWLRKELLLPPTMEVVLERPKGVVEANSAPDGAASFLTPNSYRLACEIDDARG